MAIEISYVASVETPGLFNAGEFRGFRKLVYSIACAVIAVKKTKMA
jgi:hypothetical protein